MDAKFYIKNLTNSSKQNSGEGNQNETDPIKRYLNELATRQVEKGTSYFDVLNLEDPSPTILPKNSYTTIFQQFPVDVNPENKIGNENNYEFVIVEYPDNIEDYVGNQEELIEHTKLIFINEEDAKYFLNKFIKISTKQFIKSSLYSIDSKNAYDTFGDLDINAKNLEEKIAVNNFKFAMQDVTGIGDPIVIDDIDLQAFFVLNSLNDNTVICIFNENEDKIIFTAEYDIAGAFYVIGFRFSNNAAILTENINGTNYKIVGDNINA